MKSVRKQYTEKKFFWIKQMDGRAWSAAYGVNLTLFLIEWIHFVVVSLFSSCKIIHSIIYSVQSTTYAVGQPRPPISLIEEIFFSTVWESRFSFFLIENNLYGFKIYNLKMNKNLFLGVFLLEVLFAVLLQLRVVSCRPFLQIIWILMSLNT